MNQDPRLIEIFGKQYDPEVLIFNAKYDLDRWCKIEAYLQADHKGVNLKKRHYEKLPLTGDVIVKQK